MELIEKAICECYTGTVFCIGEEREAIYKYLENLEKSPVFTHEMSKAIEKHRAEIKKDFIDVCRGKYSKPDGDELCAKLKAIVNGICINYTSCSVCPLEDYKKNQCKLIEIYREES